MPALCESLSFRPSEGFSLGLEEEVLMASASSLRPYGGTDAVLSLLEPVAGTITGEVTDGVLEFVTPIHGRVAEAIDVLRGLRAEAGPARPPPRRGGAPDRALRRRAPARRGAL
jgi:hypothetical protein